MLACSSQFQRVGVPSKVNNKEISPLPQKFSTTMNKSRIAPEDFLKDTDDSIESSDSILDISKSKTYPKSPPKTPIKTPAKTIKIIDLSATDVFDRQIN